MIKDEVKQQQKLKGKPPIMKNKMVKNRLARYKNETVLPQDRHRSEPKIRLANGVHFYNSRDDRQDSQYTMHKRKKHRKRDPAIKYLKMKESRDFPIELVEALKKKDKLSKVHLVDIYGINGEKQLRVQRSHISELRTRSQSLLKRSKMML
jgi:hypothetical protein